MKKQPLNTLLILVFIIIFINSQNRIKHFLNLFSSYEGSCVSKNIDLRGHLCIRLMNDDEIEHNVTNTNLYKSIDTGDYIIKKLWSVNFILIKKNKDTIVFK